MVKKGSDLVIFATGIMVQESLVAMEELSKDNINVTLVNISTLKPIDSELIIEQTRVHGALLTAEDHNIIGGLTESICQTLTQHQIAVPFQSIAVRDHFAESGTGPEVT